MYCIAIDLGASNSKMAAVRLCGSVVHLDDVYIFPNAPLNLGPAFYWDIFDLYRNILKGFAYFGAKFGKPVSIGIDTWGATYGFLDVKGRLAEPVFHYRDKRTVGALEQMYKTVSKRRIFDLTGCQCASSYTLAQLYASVLQRDAVLESAEYLVLLPDLLAYFLGGELSTERTIAGTTAMLEPFQRDWSRELLNALNIPSHFLLPLSDTGIVKGTLKSTIAEETGLGSAPIISAIGHDSAAAVAAIPGFDNDSLYVSMGTNVSMGMCRDVPALDDAFYRGGFKNTGSGNGGIIVYRDFPGAWIINNLYAEWVKTDPALKYDDLDLLALGAGNGPLFDIEDPAVQESGGSMSRTVAGLIARAGQPVPQSREQFLAGVMDSIALRVRYYASALAKMRGREFNNVWLISGAVRYNSLVSRIAGALQRPVFTGFPYASLTGNGVSQYYALGMLDKKQYGRQTAGASFFTDFVEMQPEALRDWPACMEWAITQKILTEAEK